MAGIGKTLEDQVSEGMGMGDHRLTAHHCKERTLTQNEMRSIGWFEQKTYNF